MPIEILPKDAASILTPQRKGFLASAPFPFTHSLSSYVGCGFGQTMCGLYCYAQFLPNWRFREQPGEWGQFVEAKMNAPQLLEQALASLKPARRRDLRIFMSSTTDPYQPAEREYQLTRQCLETFMHYPDLDLLLIQTRSPLASRDFTLLQEIPYAWLSVTIETDDQSYLQARRGGPLLEKRWQLVQQAAAAGIPTQITVSPCLPYTDLHAFAQRLLQSGASRIVVDTVIDGDGSSGARTARSPFVQTEPDWRNTTHVHQLNQYLCEKAVGTPLSIGWSIAGFCGIPPGRELKG